MHQTGKITSAQSLLVQHELGHSGRSYGTEFAERLKEAAAQAGNLQFSRHASLRMEQRGIELTGENLQELSQAVERGAPERLERDRGDRKSRRVHRQCGEQRSCDVHYRAGNETEHIYEHRQRCLYVGRTSRRGPCPEV